MAGAAIGVSHLMQATRAGARFGFQLTLLVIAINLFKYPFFEFGHRYAASAKESLLHGYRRLGRFFLWLFVVLNTFSAVISIAGVVFLTAGLSEHLLKLGWSATVWSAVIMAVCASVALIGHYRWLDRVIKVIMALLVVATVSALVLALLRGSAAQPGFEAETAWSMLNIGFLVALMGWMPAPIEVSVWQSLWVRAKAENDGRELSLKDARADFNIGYGLTTGLALVFLALGALVMHGSGAEFKTSNLAFAGQLIDLYRSALGSWSGPIVSIAALAAMFSTSLTVVDAFPRSLGVALRLGVESLPGRPVVHHAVWTVGICLPALLVIGAFANRFTSLIDLVTIIAFLAGPVFAFLNLRLITSRHTPAEARPGRGLLALSWAGMAFFVVFGVVYAVNRFSAV